MNTSPIDATTRSAALRQRLLETFDDQSLVQFCYDHAEFKPALSLFGSGQGLGEKVQRLLEFSDRRGLRDQLISEVNNQLAKPPPPAPQPGSTAGGYGSWPRAWLIGLVALLIGILGNLLAAWVQKAVLQDSFTPLRVGVILGLALLALLVSAWLERPRPNSGGSAAHATTIHDVTARVGAEVGVEAPSGANLAIDDVHASVGSKVKIKISANRSEDAS